MIMLGFSALASGAEGQGGEAPKRDTFKTDKGELAISFIGHGTLMLEWDGMVIHVDPWSKLGDYSKLPKADLILITHHHQDHLDPAAIKATSKGDTKMVLTETCAKSVEGGIVMKNGDKKTVGGIAIEAVPAYNLVHKRDNGEAFHPKGVGNGYVLTLGSLRVYIAGDTEDIPEMAKLKNIDIAFLPMNLPYTMTPEMAAKAAKSFMPKIFYPYHFGETDTSKLVALLKDTPEIEVRIRDLK
ncbi:MAG: MBL fold metallo-hydrolase [Planctomycetes bacterium]|nr:MBL fold metallo-hydrolase [Planctomycetota bacterium]